MKKEHWYYPHEEYFFWLLAIVAFFVFWSLGGVWYIVALVTWVPAWICVWIVWYLLARAR